jgi:hypothetical protein
MMIADTQHDTGWIAAAYKQKRSNLCMYQYSRMEFACVKEIEKVLQKGWARGKQRHQRRKEKTTSPLAYCHKSL